MHKIIDDPRSVPCLRPAIAAVDAAQGNVVGAYAMGDTHTYLQFRAAGGETLLTVEVRPQNWRYGAQAVEKKIRNCGLASPDNG